MAVAHSEAWESHAGTTGSASEASFNIFTSATVASCRAALVFVVTIAGTDNGSSVTWGGTPMSAISYTAADTDTEPAFIKGYFLDDCATGTVTCTVSRTNNATVMYAVAATVTAASACQIHEPGIVTQGGSSSNTGASTSGTGTGTSSTASVDDGSPGANSQRYAICYMGGNNPPGTDSSSTDINDIDFGSYTVKFVRETTPGQGSRTVGFSGTVTDDRAAIFLAVRQTAADVAAGGFPIIGGGFFPTG